MKNHCAPKAFDLNLIGSGTNQKLRIVRRGDRISLIDVPTNLRRGDLAPWMRAAMMSGDQDLDTAVLEHWIAKIQRYYSSEESILTLCMGEEINFHQSSLIHLEWEGMRVEDCGWITRIQSRTVDRQFLTRDDLILWTVIFLSSSGYKATDLRKQLLERESFVRCLDSTLIGMVAYNKERVESVGLSESAVGKIAKDCGIGCLKLVSIPGKIGLSHRIPSK